MAAIHVPGVAEPRRADRHIGALAGWRALPYRRKLQVALGLVWLLDAALQYQPYMFHPEFVNDVIVPTESGAPWIVAHPTQWAASFMLHHIGIYNALFATIQLAIAVGIFYRPTVRAALGVSVVWSLGVWWLAEGIGGIFNNASPLMGAPGAVLLYAVIALLVWPRSDEGAEKGAPAAERGLLGPTVPKVLWSALWIGFALLGLESSNRSPSAIHDMISGMESGQASWVKAIDHALEAVAAHRGTEVSIVLAVLYLLAAAAIWTRRSAPVAVGLGIGLGLVTWLAENFGGIFTGQGTDVNSGLVLILLAFCFRTGAASSGAERGVARLEG